MHRSRRRGLLERALFRVIFVRPMRCYRCNGRFYCPPTFFFKAAGHGKPGEAPPGESEAPASCEANANTTPAGKSLG